MVTLSLLKKLSWYFLQLLNWQKKTCLGFIIVKELLKMIYTIKPNYPSTIKKTNTENKIIPINNCVAKSLNPVSDKYIDIKARGKFPMNVLSNFSATNFELDGVQIKSMEGFLQSLKINNPVKQREMCLLDGFDAKKMSKSIKRSDNDMVLYWNLLLLHYCLKVHFRPCYNNRFVPE